MQRADSLKKTLLLGKTEGRRRRLRKMRCLDSINESTDMNSSKLQKTMEDRGACLAAGHGVTKRHNSATTKIKVGTKTQTPLSF